MCLHVFVVIEGFAVIKYSQFNRFMAFPDHSDRKFVACNQILDLSVHVSNLFFGEKSLTWSITIDMFRISAIQSSILSDAD